MSARIDKISIKVCTVDSVCDGNENIIKSTYFGAAIART